MGDEREPGAAPWPRIGVVIPTLNEESRLPALLERLLGPGQDSVGASACSDLADEIVVVDGGSHDATRQLASAAGVRLLEGPRGRGSQLAVGAGEVSAEVLLFLHADTLPEPGALAALRRAYCDPQVRWSAMAQTIDAPGRVYRMIESAANARARRGRVFGDSGLAVRRELYLAVGGFSDLPIFEDVDLSRRLRRAVPVHWLADVRLRISARRWEREGWLRCTLRNWVLRMAFRFGVRPVWLARCYAPHANREGQDGRARRTQGA